MTTCSNCGQPNATRHSPTHDFCADCGDNHNPAPTTPEDLAATFTAILRSWLTLRELDDIDATNRRRNDNTCATHDYCDSNMAMVEAMERHDQPWPTDDDGETPDEEYSEAHCELWSAAWDLAKARGFAS